MAMAPKLTSLILVLTFIVASTLVSTTARASQYHLEANYGPGSLKISQCPTQCKRRCKKTKHRQQSCRSFCNNCCKKCLCVPPGYSGNKFYCSCYNNWKNQQGGPKCP